ncbi:hypothetical protein KC946_01365, partial [Candidatus Saccharibacteria bacterium]|nr:hypothetical protein [Candidatus Saccharibacteria bacterium]
MRKQIKLSAVIGTCLIFALLLLAVSAVSPVNAANSVTLSFTELATHPQAAAQSTSTGKQINKLKIFNNKLFVGFGDYGSNTGPISINPFDLTTNSFDGETVSVPTESLGNWKEINGRLYTTTIDPTCSATCPAGYAVSDDGVSWIVKTPINAEHIFDVETLTGTDIWLFGSAGGPTAKAWRSIDDGETWSVVQTYENVPGDNNTERYYWGVALSGSMYMQSNYGGYQNPLQIFDGTSWSEDTTDNLCPTGSESKGPNPVVFNSSIYCKYSSGEVTVFDNSNHSTSAPDFVSARDCSNGCSSSSNDLGDMIVSGDYLYILNSYFLGYDDFLTQELVRTSDGSSWESFDGIPSTASSIEIDESANKIYVGTSDSKILVADLPDPDVSAPEVSISSPSSNTTHTGSLNIVADATDDLYVNKVEFYLDGELISSKTQSPYTATLTDRLLSNGNWSLAGQHTITAKAYDFAGNSSTSEPVNISFQTPALNVTQYQTGNPHFGSTTLTVADDGDIWFYDVGDPFMGENDFRFASLNTRTGQTTHFPFPEGLSSPNILFNDTVVNGRNNSLWYPNCNDNKLVNIIPATGDYTEYDITTGCSDSRIVIASDSEGSVYYSRPGGDTLAKISYDGQASIISTPENFSVAAMSTSSTGQIIILLGNSENGTFISKLAKINQNDELDSYYTSDETNPEETAVYGGDILLDKEGNTWVSSYPTFDFETPQLSKVSLEGDITRYSSIITENDISGNLQLAPNGDIWFQTSKGVVARFTPNSEDYETYSLLTPFDTEIIGEEINIYLGQYSSMAVDQLGNTWICDSVGNRFIKISSTVAAPDSGGS